MLIAIDGLSGSGKGSLAKILAKKLDMEHLDTGKVYRLFAYHCLQNPDMTFERVSQILDIGKINDTRLRSEKIGKKASELSAILEVRNLLVSIQRDFANNASNGAILDGRDIGTIILPDADIKFFVVADIRVRARRRLKELLELGYSVSYDEVLDNLLCRDQQDSSRVHSPLRKAKDAVEIDTTYYSIAETVAHCLDIISGVFEVWKKL